MRYSGDPALLTTQDEQRVALFGPAAGALNVRALDGFDMSRRVEDIEAGVPEGVEERLERSAMRIRVGDDGTGAGLQDPPNSGS